VVSTGFLLNPQTPRAGEANRPLLGHHGILVAPGCCDIKGAQVSAHSGCPSPRPCFTLLLLIQCIHHLSLAALGTQEASHANFPPQNLYAPPWLSSVDSAACSPATSVICMLS
jgi:hypothetical protein